MLSRLIQTLATDGPDGGLSDEQVEELLACLDVGFGYLG